MKQKEKVRLRLKKVRENIRILITKSVMRKKLYL